MHVLVISHSKVFIKQLAYPTEIRRVLSELCLIMCNVLASTKGLNVAIYILPSYQRSCQSAANCLRWYSTIDLETASVNNYKIAPKLGIHFQKGKPFDIQCDAAPA